MNKRNLIKWSFWPILIAILIAGYLFISKKAVNKHLEYIPSNAKAVIILDSKYLANDYYELLKFNPTIINEVLPPGEDEEDFELPTELPGIVPLEKMAFYLYQDNETKNQQFFRCFIATLSDEAQFLRKMNGMREKATITEIDGGKVHLFKDDNKLVLIKDNIGVVLEPINNAFKLNSEIGKRHFTNVFSSESQSLFVQSNSFKETVNHKSHVNVWAASGEGLLEGFGGSMVGIDKIFNSQFISVNLKNEDIETKVHLFLNDKDLIIQNDSEAIPLNDPEMLRLSMSLNPDKFQNYFHTLLPTDKYFLTDGWTGQVCTSIIGFRHEPVFKLKSDTVIDNADTLISVDTVELSRLMNLPHFVLAIELEDAAAVNKLINNDSLISNVDGLRYLEIPNLINEKVYLNVKGNSLLLSSTPIGFDYDPVYTTFAFNMNIEELIERYPPKDMLQAMLIPTINKFEFKSFEMHYESMNDDFICLNGKLKIGNEKIHSLLKVVPFAFNMAADL